MQRLAPALAIIALVAVTPGTAGQCETQAEKILASDGGTGSQFGNAVAMDGAVAVVGAWQADSNGTDAGEAYILRFDGSQWNEEAVLLAADGAAGDQFGGAVAIDGNLALVGAAQDDDHGSNSGSAYVFRKVGANWIQEAKLSASDGAVNDRFGIAVSVSSNVAFIGASQDDDLGGNSGSAYVFTSNGSSWSQTQKLHASDGAAFDHFGSAVAVAGNLALIGAFLHYNDQGLRTGAAYALSFSGSSWVQEDILEAPDGADYDYFGYALDVDGAQAVIGAYHDDDNGSDSGSVYVFQRSATNWTFADKLLASDGVVNDYFGLTVGLSGGDIIVGAYGSGNAGAAYWFQGAGSSWSPPAKLTAPDQGINDYFGYAVDVSSGVAVVGAHQDDDLGLSSGSVYMFEQDCAGGCSSGAQCNDGNACTVDACSNGTCGHTPVNCTDGNACTVDSCSNGACLHNPLNCNDSNSCTIDSCVAGVCNHAPNPDCGEDCAQAADCADLDGDGVRDDSCVWWSCVQGACLAVQTVFADLGGSFGECRADGVVDNHDSFHALNCFANENAGGGTDYPCEESPPAAFNVDAGGPFGDCQPDGFCDGHDAFHVIEAFDGDTLCSCGPQPSPSGGPEIVAAAGIMLQAWPSRASAGDLIEVDVLLDGELTDLRGYQLGLRARGGQQGRVDLADIFVDDSRPDHVFRGAANWSAFNVNTAQVVVGMTSPGVRTAPDAYLATFVYRASKEARGVFTIEVSTDSQPVERPSYLFPTASGARIDISTTRPISIIIGNRR